MTAAEAAPESVRSRLALALDVDDSVAAARLANELRPWFGVAKVGPGTVQRHRPGHGPGTDRRRLHGLPRSQDGRHPQHRQQGGPGARRPGRLLPDLPRLRRVGGPAGRRRRAGRGGGQGRPAAARGAGGHHPDQRPRRPAPHPGQAGGRGRRVALRRRGVRRLRRPRSQAAGAPADRRGARRPPRGKAIHDQVRSATPAEAVAAGADLLVVGRPVTGADDRTAAAAAIAASIS